MKVIVAVLPIPRLLKSLVIAMVGGVKSTLWIASVLSENLRNSIVLKVSLPSVPDLASIE